MVKYKIKGWIGEWKGGGYISWGGEFILKGWYLNSGLN